ncbi:cation transporter [Patescibacteria group bacterium]|nr:cation transporter [Patescibacteria group bacterium]
MPKTITLHPSRIGCPSIPGTIKGIIMSIEGVQDVKVRYEERSLDVTFDEDKVNPEEITKKIGEEMGLAMEVAEHGSKKQENVTNTCPM